MHYMGLIDIFIGFILGIIGTVMYDTFLDQEAPTSDELSRYSTDSKRAMREFRIRKFLRWLV